MAKYDKNKLGKITGKHITEATSKKGTKAGEFTEAAGGGSPIEAGEKFKLVDSSKEAEEYRENHPGAKVRVMQPRDDDGKFTYNSANLRDRKHEYHGKGKRDGSGESASFPLNIDYDKLAEIFVTDNVMTADDAKRYISGITLTVEELKQAVKKFSEEEGAFAGGLGSDKAFVKKVGRKSKSEAETGLGRVDRAKLSEMTVNKLEEAGKAKTDIPDDTPVADKTPTPTPAPVKEKEPVGVGATESGNVNLAEFNANPQEFYNKNKDKINKIVELSGNKLSAKSVLANIKAGKINNLDTLIAKLKGE